MKNKSYQYALWFFLFLTFVGHVSRAQVHFTKFAFNPVMEKEHAFFETYAIGQPCVILENDTFRMWYAEAGIPFITSRMAYAWSTDGINWTRTHNVLSPGIPGDWDLWMDTPYVIKEPNGYRMFYFGDKQPGATGNPPTTNASIGIALSQDGLQWSKFAGNPILQPGPPGSWDASWIESPAVIYDSIQQEYRMWYTGVDTSQWKIQIGLATSTDGFQWSKHPGNPVLETGNPGEFDDMWAAVPEVLYIDGEYQMWYCGFSSLSGFDTIRIGYAHSTDGINWVKSPFNPILGTYTTPHNIATDSAGPWAPALVFDPGNNQYMMWYETAAGFCYASAPVSSAAYQDVTALQMNIYPNPVLRGNILNIISSSRLSGILQLMDMTGRILLDTPFEGDRTTISTGRLPDGIYIINLHTDKGTKAARLMVY